jgi:hypothetical protein
MKEIKVPIEYATTYVANDGVEWSTKHQCEQYEKLLNDTAILKSLNFYNQEGNPINIFELKRIPAFSYLVLTQDIERYDSKVIKAIICGNRTNDDLASYDLPTSAGVWYNDWTNAYSGEYGFNGWIKEWSIDTYQQKIKEMQNKVLLLSKILKK